MMSCLRCLLPHVGPAIFERMHVGMVGLVILLGVAMFMPGRPAVAAGVTLTVDKNNVFAGEQFVLTATAATESNIRILGIDDAGNRGYEGGCTATYRCSLARSNNGLRILRYIAVAQDRGTLAESESSIVTVQRKDMVITLKADKTTVNNWERVTFTMTPNQSQVDIQLMQVGIGGQPDGSVNAQSCRVFSLPTGCQTTALNYPGGPSREYYATMRMISTGEVVRSGIVKISRNPLEIRIEADRPEAADYETINLTATSNQSGTQIALLMAGSPDAAFAWCPSSGSLICTGRTVLAGARTATFYAVMRDPNGGEVQSNRVMVRRSPVTVTLMANKQEVKPGESFTLNATRNQTGGGLAWAIYDADTGKVAPPTCVPASTTCSVSDTLGDKPQRQFKAVVFERDGGVAGQSEVVTVTKPKPKVTLALAEGSESEILPHEGVSLVATVDQLADQVTITNRRTGRNLQVSCIRATPTTCTASDAPFVEENGSIGPPPPTVANYIAVAKVGPLQGESKNVRVNRIELTPTLEAGRLMDRAAIQVDADVPRLPSPARLLGYLLQVEVLKPNSDPRNFTSWERICARNLFDTAQIGLNCRNIVLTDPALVSRDPPPQFRAGVFYGDALVSELVYATVGAPKKPTVILDADDLVIGGGVGNYTTTLTATVTPAVDDGVSVLLRVTKPDGSTRTERMTRPDDRNPSRYTATVSTGDVQPQGRANYQVEIVLGEDVLATSNEVEIRHAPLE